MTSLHRTFGWLSLLIVVAAIIPGFLLAGSPAKERERQEDARRVQDLRTIQSEISRIVHGDQPWDPTRVGTAAKPLPQTLDAAAQEAVYQKLTTTDPVSGQPYEYAVKDATHYQLCATFTQPLQQTYDIFWNHPAGRSCYDFDVNAAVK